MKNTPIVQKYLIKLYTTLKLLFHGDEFDKIMPHRRTGTRDFRAFFMDYKEPR